VLCTNLTSCLHKHLPQRQLCCWTWTALPASCHLPNHHHRRHTTADAVTLKDGTLTVSACNHGSSPAAPRTIIAAFAHLSRMPNSTDLFFSLLYHAWLPGLPTATRLPATTPHTPLRLPHHLDSCVPTRPPALPCPSPAPPHRRHPHMPQATLSHAAPWHAADRRKAPPTTGPKPAHTTPCALPSFIPPHKPLYCCAAFMMDGFRRGQHAQWRAARRALRLRHARPAAAHCACHTRLGPPTFCAIPRSFPGTSPTLPHCPLRYPTHTIWTGPHTHTGYIGHMGGHSRRGWLLQTPKHHTTFHMLNMGLGLHRHPWDLHFAPLHNTPHTPSFHHPTPTCPLLPTAYHT